MKRVLAAFLLCLAVPLSAQPAASQDQAAQDAALGRALQSIKAGKPTDAVATLDPLLADYERQYAAEKRTIYCSGDMTTTLLYMGAAAVAAGKGKGNPAGSIAIDMGWCMALWAKGFALIDLERLDEAVPYLERSVAMAPSHAQFLAELGFAYQAQKKPQASYGMFERAAAAAERGPDALRTAGLRRAWFGMAFALVEMDRLDEAEALLEKCLELTPDDKRVQGELQYVREAKAKKR